MNPPSRPPTGLVRLARAFPAEWARLVSGMPFSRGLAHRALILTSAYVVTSAVVLAAAVGLGQLVTPSLLAGVLSVFFISMLSSGLEPGTAKALVLQGSAPAADRAQLQGLALASMAKALVASAPLGLLWRISDQSLAWPVMAWVPAIVVAGFLATDFRVVLDVQGRYATAIWLKQSGLVLAFGLLAGLVGVGVSLEWAVAASAVARLAWTFAALIFVFRDAPPAETRAGAAELAVGYLRHGVWWHLAAVSALAALSGSLDRVVALRLLSPADYNAYFIVYEITTKLWLLPYIVAPILFARHASGNINRRLLAVIHMAVGAAGSAYGLMIVLVAALAPRLFELITGLEQAPVIALSGFVAAIVISSFCQLILIDLQARGAARAATILTLASLAASVVLFYGLSAGFGLAGLLWAWLLKSCLELILSLGMLRRAVAR